MEKVKRNGYTFQESFHDAMSGLPDLKYGRIMRAINEYALYGIEPPSLEGIELMVWKLIHPQLEKSRNKANGRAGAPKGNQNALKNQATDNQKTIKKQSKNNQTRNKKKSNSELIDSKESPLSSPLEETPPIPPKEDNPPIIPQETTYAVGGETVVSQGKGSKVENSMARKVFEAHYKETFGADYYWTAKDAGLMTKLLNKIRFSRTQRGLTTDSPSMMAALKALLASIQDGWIFENFSVANITSKYNEIVARAQVKLNGNRYETNRTANNAERRNIDAARNVAAFLADDDD